ncbi:hypothetical protein BSR29_03565 [Boudabousia liubingyangii]|uniref:FtsX-like permease family protein n=1 Tax=Boudabousia liubingyangii TaxID=1921764 RepID=A0A1Q5PMZ7_9ACTO|nr:hypothetical protein [Boudabousia liubingyangii]OKL47508.1 hypothetical protein BSR28_03135 [Boudabousia liubingyangii]OKL48931.1 hypothetical protein BSR29_03565 [Boudabousia liubingyangii]
MQVAFRHGFRYLLVFTLAFALGSALLLNLLTQNAQVELKITKALNAQSEQNLDLLVRPKTNLTEVENTLNLVRPDYLYDARGGITPQQLQAIKEIPNVKTAAPAAALGILPVPLKLKYQIPPQDLAGGSQPSLFRYVGEALKLSEADFTHNPQNAPENTGPQTATSNTGSPNADSGKTDASESHRYTYLYFTRQPLKNDPETMGYLESQPQGDLEFPIAPDQKSLILAYNCLTDSHCQFRWPNTVHLELPLVGLDLAAENALTATPKTLPTQTQSTLQMPPVQQWQSQIPPAAKAEIPASEYLPVILPQSLSVPENPLPAFHLNLAQLPNPQAQQFTQELSENPENIDKYATLLAVKNLPINTSLSASWTELINQLGTTEPDLSNPRTLNPVVSEEPLHSYWPLSVIKTVSPANYQAPKGTAITVQALPQPPGTAPSAAPVYRIVDRTKLPKEKLITIAATYNPYQNQNYFTSTRGAAGRKVLPPSFRATGITLAPTPAVTSLDYLNTWYQNQTQSTKRQQAPYNSIRIKLKDRQPQALKATIATILSDPKLHVDILKDSDYVAKEIKTLDAHQNPADSTQAQNPADSTQPQAVFEYWIAPAIIPTLITANQQYHQTLSLLFWVLLEITLVLAILSLLKLQSPQMQARARIGWRSTRILRTELGATSTYALIAALLGILTYLLLNPILLSYAHLENPQSSNLRQYLTQSLPLPGTYLLVTLLVATFTTIGYHLWAGDQAIPPQKVHPKLRYLTQGLAVAWAAATLQTAWYQQQDFQQTLKQALSGERLQLGLQSAQILTIIIVALMALVLLFQTSRLTSAAQAPELRTLKFLGWRPRRLWWTELKPQLAADLLGLTLGLATLNLTLAALNPTFRAHLPSALVITGSILSAQLVLIAIGTRSRTSPEKR